MEHNLLFNAMVYLAAAVLVVPLAKRLALGAVLGYLLAGILIGPYGFRLISEVEDALHFAEFGVVLLLFLIGLELEPSKLWSLRRPIFGWGGAQVLGVAAGLCGAAILAGIDWKVALIAGLGLSLSSTAIALASLEERNLMPTPAGQAGFSILLFQDIAAIPMIAIVPLLGIPEEAGGGGNAWQAVLKVVVVLAGLIVAGRFLVRPLLRVIAKTDTREIFTAFALLMVIAISLLMQWIGVSMALGAFMAGVLLADSEYRHALESDVEPFKGLLLGLFFIAVGMSVDFAVFLAQPLLILGLVAGFQVIKIALLYALSRALGMARGQHLQFALLLSQGGEFAFVVFGAAATARVFSSDVASILVVVVALSMVVTPLTLMLYDRIQAWRQGGDGAKARKKKADAIEPNEDHVIIAGFGRFGQIVGRFLHANDVRLTVLDHDPDQIEVLRHFGFKVFYGDATRADLLRAAGAAKARAVVVAIDDIDDSLALVDTVRRDYPDLPIFARARNVTHYYQLMDLGVTMIERETYESALKLGRTVLTEGLGQSAYRTRNAANRFRRHNKQSLEAVYPYYKDRETFVSLSKQAREELEEMIARDRRAAEEEKTHYWD
ncbi:glutathione-regulated potassium-efflux system protein KefC [Massilia sp. YIM B02763]|uniref:glutathione-regulated potassium-efflux system protein KefC n=1 Tax=Massilia sp. YIM B02763 TaxID=3050130 RepID=UPI0025B725FB|nr:glutathione-regulated potassium-efflux system protein KefC [Massilia sp. YIM B02763]MDN4054018.1 glutathione-regulated potassium-efflux system protein KefC [Massilia sp. YIM B02763]